jgi:PPE-repeat protein
MLDFGLLPPEVNSGRMYSGPGSEPMLAAAAAWDELAAELSSAATGYNSVISELTSAPWIGPASTAMVAAATPYGAWLSATAAQAEHTASQARAAVAAYEAAFALTVPPPVIAANRALLMALIATNFFGQNTPAIAATEAQYAEMWAQDAAAMYGYAGASSAASTVTPFNPPANTTNPAGLARQAAAVAKAAATPAGSSAQTTRQLVSATTVSQTSAASWALQQIEGLTSANQAMPLKLIVQTAYRGLGTLQYGGSLAQQLTFGSGTTAGSGGARYPTPQFAGLGQVGGIRGGPVSASVGRANSIGPLSVPPSWAAVPSATGSAASELPGTFSSAASAGSPTGLLRGIPLSSVGRRGADDFVHRYGFRYTVMPRPPAAG